MNRLKLSEAREIRRKLSRVDLSSAEYGYVKSIVEQFVKGFYIRAFTLKKGQRLYRGVKYDFQPDNVSFLGAPPAHKVEGFQRCNKPHSPMFYCSVDPAAVFYELDVKEGDVVYLSKWSVDIDDFFVSPVVCQLDDDSLYSALDMVYTYFETVFSQPVHDTFSYQYKVTAAISELLAARGVNGDPAGREIGGLSFPSVSHPNCSDNLVLYPDVSERCLSLDYVEEVEVIKVSGKTIDVKFTDISNSFDSGVINWAGRPGEWSIAPGQVLTFTAEPDGWVARDSVGNVVSPS